MSPPDHSVLTNIRKAFDVLFEALLIEGGKPRNVTSAEAAVACMQLFICIIKGNTDSVDKICLALDEVKPLISSLDTEAGILCLWQNFESLMNKEEIKNG